MSKYPNISKFMPELKIEKYMTIPLVQDLQKGDFKIQDSKRDAVLASDLEAVLAKAPKWKDNDTNETFIALKPIESSEPVSIEEVKEMLDAITSEKTASHETWIEARLKKIIKNGVAK